MFYVQLPDLDSYETYPCCIQHEWCNITSEIPIIIPFIVKTS